MRPSLIGRIPGRDVRIYIVGDVLRRFGDMFESGRSGSAIELIVDRAVASSCVRLIEKELRRVGFRPRRLTVTGGEMLKSETMIRRLHNRWFAAKVDRHTPIIAIGGGTVTDSVGYAAATFMRGLPLWFVPTTIVGQVDAAIGGKVGINHKRGKNLIGAYYHPEGIVIDPALAATLSERDRRAGLAEVVKYGVIADATLFGLCEKRVPDWVTGTRSPDVSVIRTCVKIKCDVVAADEHDRGLRHVLNFGHTMGHAFESWGGYRKLRHGEAVALGMVAAAWIAMRRKTFPAASFDRLAALCRYLRPARKLPVIPVATIVQRLAYDKKRRSGRNLWVLPKEIGQVEICDDISTREVRGAIEYVNRWLDS